MKKFNPPYTVPESCHIVKISLLANFTIIVAFSEKDLKKVSKEDFSWYKTDEGDCAAFATTACNKDKVHYGILYFETNDLSIISHECVHMAHRIMSIVGIPISRENTEIEAYLVGYMVGSVLEFLNKS